ncbi:hypothetical protein GCM10009075_03970 [Sphingomonas trueperi]
MLGRQVERRGDMEAAGERILGLYEKGGIGLRLQGQSLGKVAGPQRAEDRCRHATGCAIPDAPGPARERFRRISGIGEIP